MGRPDLALELAMIVGGAVFALALAYAVVVGHWAIGFRQIATQAPESRPLNGSLPLVSVIVPARDEEHSIEACLQSILANDYPPECFEIIVVDDLSRDRTPAVVTAVAREASMLLAVAGSPDDGVEPSRVRLLQMPPHLERSRAHKKRAIAHGIAHARGSIILSTDADCVVPRAWIRTMAACFGREVGLVSGPVLYPLGASVARDVQALEFLGLVAVGAGAIGAKRPNLCNGANVAYRISAFREVGGFSGIDHLTSGDDELLMQKIAYTTDWEVRFCASPDAAVTTEGAASIGSFFQQRKRWASKGRHYPHTPLRATIATIYLFYLALLAAPFLVVGGVLSAGVVGAAVAMKVASETALLWPASRRFGRESLMKYFLPAQPLHVLYIVTMGLAGAVGGYEWKGRRVDR